MTSPVCCSSPCRFDPDGDDRPATALGLTVGPNEAEQPVHAHRKGQLALAVHGAMTCEAPRAKWLVPPNHAIWIPGGTPHSNDATDNAQVYFLFIEPGAAPMPGECCTLAISPLVRELIVHLAGQGQDYPPQGTTARLVAVLLEHLTLAPVEMLSLPMPGNARLRRVAQALESDPSDRTTLVQWAGRLAMSDRSLARLVRRETGLTFGRWRQQLHLMVALRELASGATVQQVAGRLGYGSVTAFITMFKKALGQPPASYFAALR